MQYLFMQLKPGDYEKIDVSSGVVGFTAAKLNPVSNILGPALCARVVAVGGDISFRTDGNDPSATEGLPVTEKIHVDVIGHQALKNFKAIKLTGTTVTLRVQYYHA